MSHPPGTTQHTTYPLHYPHPPQPAARPPARSKPKRWFPDRFLCRTCHGVLAGFASGFIFPGMLLSFLGWNVPPSFDVPCHDAKARAHILLNMKGLTLETCWVEKRIIYLSNFSYLNWLSIWLIDLSITYYLICVTCRKFNALYYLHCIIIFGF